MKKLYTTEALQERTITIQIITGEKKYTLWYQYKKKQISHSIYTGRSCNFLTSDAITGVQMGQMFRLG
jgi:hypothetical protein